MCLGFSVSLEYQQTNSLVINKAIAHTGFRVQRQTSKPLKQHVLQLLKALALESKLDPKSSLNYKKQDGCVHYINYKHTNCNCSKFIGFVQD